MSSARLPPPRSSARSTWSAFPVSSASSPSELSGGQQQRIALARAIVIEPDVLLLDEPLSALDANLREEMRTELKIIQREVGITTIFVTHDQEEALAMSDRIVVMNHGKVEQTGTPESVYRAPASRFVASFLGQSNLLPGRVASIDDGIALVAIDRGPELAVAAPAGSGRVPPSPSWSGPSASMSGRPKRRSRTTCPAPSPTPPSSAAPPPI